MNMNTKVTSKPRLLSELLRPQEIGDLTLPASDIEHLSRMVTSRSIMNMLFYGKPGLAKHLPRGQSSGWLTPTPVNSMVRKSPVVALWTLSRP